MGYFKSVIRGLSWSFTLRFFIRGFTIVRTIILARILLPAQFGAYSIATITLAVLEMLTETGINVFVIPAIVKFQKDLKFNKEFAFKGMLLTIEAAVAISLAFILRSPVSLAVSL